MQKVGLIFDSTAVIHPAFVEKYSVEFVSLFVTINGESNLGMDLNEDVFRHTFLTYKSVQTASPSPHVFETAMRKQLAKGFEHVVVIALSSKISTTYNAALIARDALEPELQDKVIVYDSLYGSIGMDALTPALDEVLATNPDIETFMTELKRRNANSVVLFEINDLKHLFKGGRLSAVKYFISSALKVKPLVEFAGGTLTVIGKNRNRNKTIEVLTHKIEHYTEQFMHVFINLFSFDEEDSGFKALTAIIKERFSSVSLNFANRIDPVFMTHVGVKGYAVSVVAFN